MDISPELLAEVVAHVSEDPTVELCGLVAVKARENLTDPASAVRVYRTLNTHATALRFEIEGAELLALMKAIEAEGNEIGAIYHSHVRSAPYPSQTDINYAANWPGVEWIIVGLLDRDSPEVRSYLIDGGQVQEVGL